MSTTLQNWGKTLAFKLGVGLYRMLAMTWRVKHIDHPSITGGIVYGHFHGDELLLISAFSGEKMGKMAVMASLSKDGTLQAQFLKQMGYEVVRGSSSRGGAQGLKGLIDCVLEKKTSASLAVDGPRGPIYQVKMGVLKLAQLTERPLVVGACGTSSAYVFKKAWNQCFLPYPFSKNVVCYSEPFYVDKNLSDEALEKLGSEIQEKLFSLKKKAMLECR